MNHLTGWGLDQASDKQRRYEAERAVDEVLACARQPLIDAVGHGLLRGDEESLQGPGAVLPATRRAEDPGEEEEAVLVPGGLIDRLTRQIQGPGDRLRVRVRGLGLLGLERRRH